MPAAKIAFWSASALIVYTHAGYPLLLAGIARARGTRARNSPQPAEPPSVALIVAAHDEQAVIERWVDAALALDYPRERLQVVVACDGCTDATAALARKAGADHVLELERGGKDAALNAAVDATESDIVAFSDANAIWSPDALSHLAERLVDPSVGYVCGQVRFEAVKGATNQEGLYWRYEMALRSLESDLAGVTAGNGAINAVRRIAYIRLDAARGGQDICFPFELTKRGWRAEYEERAVATELMTPTVEDEFRRKRRMMKSIWNTILGTSLLDPRGYSPMYALEIYSHRLLRYATPMLHVAALAANVAALRSGRIYRLAFATHAAFASSVAAGGPGSPRPLLLARYYAAVTASSALGLWDLLRQGASATWDQAEGTR